MKTAVFSADPLGGSDLARAERGVDVSHLARMAFAHQAGDPFAAPGRHLALLPTEMLAIDLDDPEQRRFGDYDLLELIGEGGMGVVYRARQISLDREVAVKLLAAGVWASKEFVERFRREAQNVARMQHPNIVTVHEVGSQDEMHFFSMQLVRGSNLASERKRLGRLPPRRAAELLRIVAEALDYAHRLGVLHLDLKPANVLLDENGIPHVADFGLARRLDDALSSDGDEVSGTPSYMAPEQASPRIARITRATDIWGLGAILYELVTGLPPFLAGTPQETLNRVVQGQLPSPRKQAPDLPRDLEAVILKCMAYRTEERYASARELADDLQAFLDGRAVSARPLRGLQRLGRWARREPRLAAMTGMAFAALVAGLLATTSQWRRADANAEAARGNLWATRAQAAQNAFAGGDGFAGLRPLVANLAEMEAGHHDADAAIERQRIGTILANAPRLLDVVRLPGDEQATSLAISPDGRHVAVATSTGGWYGARHVRQYDLASLHPEWSKSADDQTFLMGGGDEGMPLSALHYSADGRHLLASAIDQPVVPAPRWSDMIAFATGDGRVVLPGQLPRKQADIVFDDRMRIALVRYRSDASLRWPDSGQFHEVDGWKPIGPLHTLASTLTADNWLPAPVGDAWLGTRDSARLALYEVPSLHPRWQLDLPQTSLVRAWAFSHDGRRIALGSVDGSVRLIDAGDGHAAALASAPTARVMRVAFSADNRTLAAVDKNGQMWAWDVASGRPRTMPLALVSAESEADLLRFAGAMLFGGSLTGQANAELNYANLTDPAPFNNTAVPGAARLHGSTPFGTAFDVSTVAQRLVRGDGNLLEVWTLPRSPLLRARAAPLPTNVQRFDGKRVVAVDGATVRLVDAVTGAALSPPLQHPQAVRLAELAAGGHRLVTLAGRSVRVIDTTTWRLHGAPVVLPQTPQRAVLAASAPVLALTTTAYDGDLLRETIWRIDLDRGVLLGRPTTVDSLSQLWLDPQGRHAIVMTTNSLRHDESGPVRIALDDGAPGCRPALHGVRNLAFAPDGRSAWFDVALDGRSSLRRWDLEACRESAAYDLHQRQTATPVLFARADGSLVVHRVGKQALLTIAADGRLLAAVGEGRRDEMYDVALSADGQRAAFATRNAVRLVDARHGRSLSAPLTAPIAGDDAIAMLAFAPDGASLLARTINGRWLLWPLPGSTWTTPALARLCRLLDPDPAQPVSAADLTALRADLHAATVPAPTLPAVEATPIAFPAAPEDAIDPRFVALDLHAAIGTPMIGRVWSEPGAGGDLPTLAPGLQRFLGVDYRIDGGIQLSGGGTALALGPELHRSAVVAVPDVVATRLHVLAFMHIPMNAHAPSRPFAYAVLIGADGRETRLEIRTVRDVVTHFFPERAAPGARVAFAASSSASVRAGEPVQPAAATFAVTLAVPAGTGAIRGLRFEVGAGPAEAPLLFAATLERAAPAATTPPGESR